MQTLIYYDDTINHTITNRQGEIINAEDGSSLIAERLYMYDSFSVPLIWAELELKRKRINKVPIGRRNEVTVFLRTDNCLEVAYEDNSMAMINYEHIKGKVIDFCIRNGDILVLSREFPYSYIYSTKSSPTIIYQTNKLSIASIETDCSGEIVCLYTDIFTSYKIDFITNISENKLINIKPIKTIPSIEISTGQNNQIVMLHGGPVGFWDLTYNFLASNLFFVGNDILMLNHPTSSLIGWKNNIREIASSDIEYLLEFICDQKPSILVAESFGSYLLFQALSKLSELNENIKVILLNGFTNPEQLLNSSNPAIAIIKKRMSSASGLSVEKNIDLLYIYAQKDELINVDKVTNDLSKIKFNTYSNHPINSGHSIDDPSNKKMITDKIMEFIAGRSVKHFQ